MPMQQLPGCQQPHGAPSLAACAYKISVRAALEIGPQVSPICGLLGRGPGANLAGAVRMEK